MEEENYSQIFQRIKESPQALKHYSIGKGILYYKEKKVVKKGQTEGIMSLYHQSDLAGHRGIANTLFWIKKEYYWPNMHQEVKQFVESCHKCQFQNVKKTQEPTHKLVVEAPWERVQIDVIGPLELSDLGNRYIVTAIDCFTRWPEARAVPAANAGEIIKFVWEDIICRHGVVGTIQTDQGTEFINEKFTKFCRDKGIHHHVITAYHPQANGQVERLNGTLKKTLMKISEESYEWDLSLSAALFSIRNSKHAATQTTPAFMNYGRDLKFPFESHPSTTIWEHMRMMISDLPLFNSGIAEKLRNMEDDDKEKINNYKVGQQVLVFRNWIGRIGKTFKDKWDGPYTIIKAGNYGTYVLQDDQGNTTKPIHGNRLKLYKDRMYLEPIVVIA